MIFFDLLAYTIQISIILAFFFVTIFQCWGLLGPRLGSSKKKINHWQKHVTSEKWLKEKYGINDWTFWLGPED